MLPSAASREPWVSLAFGHNMNPANRITIVADYDFRQGLAGFPEAEPVWIADTPGNRVIIEKA